MSTINPADCDRTTVYAGECRNFSDTEWITFDAGRRRSPDASDRNTWLVDVGFGSLWVPDHKVRNLVRLVPARPDRSGVDWKAMYEQASRERDEAERELDEATRRLRAVKVDHGRMVREWEEMRRERDEWEGKYLDTDKALHDSRRERDSWRERAESAEVQTSQPEDTPTRAEVEETLQAATNSPSGWTLHGLTDAVCDLFGIPAEQAVDPVMSRAREYAAAGGIDFDKQGPGVVNLLMKVAEHVIGGETDE